MKAETYAHSLPGRPVSDWETLPEHLQSVGRAASLFAAAFDCGEAGKAMGLLHDIGKVSKEFQAYLRDGSATADNEAARRGGDHSTAGARAAVERYGGIGRLLAYGIAGHHAGLADWVDGLERRLDPGRCVIPAYPGWEDHPGPLPNAASLLPSTWRPGPRRGFGQAFLARMLFSCLVDADSMETRRFYADAAGEAADPPFASTHWKASAPDM